MSSNSSSPSAEKTAFHLTEIVTNLFIGDIMAAEMPELLQELGITSILTVASSKITMNASRTFRYKHIALQDDHVACLLPVLSDALEFVEEGLEAGKVLVHCGAGRSRSGAIVVAHVMRSNRMSLQDSLRLVREQRPVVEPNENFMEQLALFESMGFQFNPDDMRWRQLNLRRLLNKAQAGEINLADMGFLQPESTDRSDVVYKCRKCRRTLFKESSVLPHRDEIRCRQNQLFVEPVQWMAGNILTTEGKLYCPECSSKIGSFSWWGGQCPCGQWMVPSFHIITSKVDRFVPIM